jgi:tetratricopeptide (TPR) repeat protein
MRALRPSSELVLPPVPGGYHGGVAAWSEPVTIDSYLPVEPSPFPAFLARRVYQGSSGRTYPLPFHERIAEPRTPTVWTGLHLENEWLRLLILPELGGRVHVAYDKSADYDIFYRNNVIKPALVGLAGPWLSGGIEFNWPQHHRPTTFLPTQWEIEREVDGTVTVWCGDHDPLSGMKGMHGIRMRPDSSLIEARVRLFNRTELPQTFLWWANVAVAVNDDYQSFFPTDVHWVADHARRAFTTFPAATIEYYGIDYPSRVTEADPLADRLDWYRNIPVPTSYMVTHSEDDFFGGYDHGREAGFVHWADHHIAPGKKQWTWGNSAFGRAWEQNLTDDDGPYIELMAGVFTDNQPDFSHIAPGETKQFSQYWYPIHGIGPVHQATTEAAVRLDVRSPDGGEAPAARIAVAVVSPHPEVDVVLRSAGRIEFSRRVSIAPDRPLILDIPLAEPVAPHHLSLSVSVADRVLVEWTPRKSGMGMPPVAAREPEPPAAVASTEELALTGEYLQLYRHATREPEPYWQEAVRRDPGHSPSHLGLGQSLYRSGRFAEAELEFRAAVDRLTMFVPNPAVGDAHYLLGLTLERMGRVDEAVDMLEKSRWNAAWRVPASYAIAMLHARRGDRMRSEIELRSVLRLDPDHLLANAMLIRLLRRSGRTSDERVVAEELHRSDPLAFWESADTGMFPASGTSMRLDTAIECGRWGFYEEALGILAETSTAEYRPASGQVNVAPLMHYHRAAMLELQGRMQEAEVARDTARATPWRHCLASRLSDLAVLMEATEKDPTDGLAWALLGHWNFEKGNADLAIHQWRVAAESCGDPELRATVNRNLGLALMNVHQDGAAASSAYERARADLPADAKLLYEFDQLRRRLKVAASERLSVLQQHLDLVNDRDDLTIAYAELLIEVGRPRDARDALLARTFQPWEGGEGLVLAVWKRAQLALADEAPDAAAALELIEEALHPPANLGEQWHPLANLSRLLLVRGDLHARLGRQLDAQADWRMASASATDFIGMSPTTFSLESIWSIRALLRLGLRHEAAVMLDRFEAFIRLTAATDPVADFFATSLPSMMEFPDDPLEKRDADVRALREQLAALQGEYRGSEGADLPITAG